jgi:hypothetical protein
MKIIGWIIWDSKLGVARKESRKKVGDRAGDGERANKRP